MKYKGFNINIKWIKGKEIWGAYIQNGTIKTSAPIKTQYKEEALYYAKQFIDKEF